MTLDSEKLLNPREVLLEMQDSYWHTVKQAAAYLKQDIRRRENPSVIAGMIVGFGSGNYADILSQMANRMPSSESGALLGKFIGYLRSIEVLGRDLQNLPGIVDEAFLCYLDLVASLRSETELRI